MHQSFILGDFTAKPPFLQHVQLPFESGERGSARARASERGIKKLCFHGGNSFAIFSQSRVSRVVLIV